MRIQARSQESIAAQLAETQRFRATKALARLNKFDPAAAARAANHVVEASPLMARAKAPAPLARAAAEVAVDAMVEPPVITEVDRSTFADFRDGQIGMVDTPHRVLGAVIEVAYDPLPISPASIPRYSTLPRGL
jgi:hypothetical protein